MAESPSKPTMTKGKSKVLKLRSVGTAFGWFLAPLPSHPLTYEKQFAKLNTTPEVPGPSSPAPWRKDV